MHDSKTMKRGAWLATAALATGMGLAGAAGAADNPFRMTELDGGYRLAHQDEHAEAEPARSPEADKEKVKDMDDGKRGKAVPEGRCGSEHMKLNEGKCGGH